MKKNHFILLGVLALLIVGIIIGRKRQQANQPLSSLYEKLAVKDTNDIGKVFMADRYGNQAILERKGDGWMYTNKANGLESVANDESISLLLKSLSEIRIRSKVPRNAEQTAVREMSGESTKIEVYSTSGKLLRTYYVGRNAVNDIGSYTMVEGEEIVYISFIPGEPGELMPRFSALERTWRDKKLFRYKKTPKSIKLEYLLPGQEQYGLLASREGESYSVKPLNPSANFAAADFQELLVKDYFTLYRSIGAETIVDDKFRRDSLVLSSKPFCKISVVDHEGKLKTAQFNALEMDPIRDDGIVSVRGQIQRFVVLVNEGENVMVMQQRVVGKLFQSAGYFYGKADL